ncbi:MAG: DUF3110 domain-containing protein [Phormidesmis priestleyi]|uniref:DUF3110 domain-containing protein n=1 Tax=Phormidesmis priestleyi TaxID=268141 RepID=A0A2W4WVE2_9CYAN|nr:MAG: DUF3110 domain-containing protein [Phormidesmis priestleyi]
MLTTMFVYVVLFNVGTENEGIHSIRIGDRHQVLMFESEDDAIRFGILLEAQDSPPPTIEKMDREEIEEICEDAGYEPVFVPEGELVTPVENMVEKTLWNPDADSSDEPAQPTRSAADDEMDRIRRQLERLL